MKHRQDYEIRLKEIELRDMQEQQRFESDQLLRSMMQSQMDLLKNLLMDKSKPN